MARSDSDHRDRQRGAATPSERPPACMMPVLTENQRELAGTGTVFYRRGYVNLSILRWKGSECIGTALTVEGGAGHITSLMLFRSHSNRQILRAEVVLHQDTKPEFESQNLFPCTSNPTFSQLN
jgi:hypothetical protein